MIYFRIVVFAYFGYLQQSKKCWKNNEKKLNFGFDISSSKKEKIEKITGKTKSEGEKECI